MVLYIMTFQPLGGHTKIIVVVKFNFSKYVSNIVTCPTNLELFKGCVVDTLFSRSKYFKQVQCDHDPL